jgi:hypothetical protein
MTAARRDYKVTFRREESIESLAWRCRLAAGLEFLSYFSIVDYIEQFLAKWLKGGVRLCFFDMNPGDDPARVEYNPTTLYIDREVWELAKLGEPEARFIVAHEIGHLVLHDHNAKAFSNDPDAQIRFAPNEYSAEWQATIFAYYFLLPTVVVASFEDPLDLSKSCAVPQEVAAHRHNAVRRSQRPAVIREGDFCARC